MELALISVTLTFLVMPSAVLGDVAQGRASLDELHFDYPVGDPRRCVQQARQTHMDVNRFEVLPGVGWDNLRNVEMGLVVRYNYSLCKVTDDGRFLIPDNVVALPIKSSMVETFAEMIDNYVNMTSTTSTNINVNAGLFLAKFTASGSFSYEHRTLKSKQIEDKALTTRVQLRYHRYQARLQPDPKLDPHFKNRVLTIAGHLLLNETEQALYEGQLLVRDFGTHIQTSVVAGAGLTKTDFLKRHLITTKDEDKTKYLAQASASFFGIFHMGSSYSHTTDKTVATKYNKSMTHSFITTHGGGMLGANTSLAYWTQGVDTNLVAMDRAGDPLNYLITSRVFPELPAPTLAALEKVIRTSIEVYYEMNTIRGCMADKSPNFNPAANVDDGTCNAQATNFTLGGVYQTCRVTSGQFIHNNPCTNLTQVNPSTGKASCPTGYKAIKIFTGSRTSATENKHLCHRCWIFAHCCHTDQIRATATFETYWCAATGQVKDHSGYMFGGVYTTHTENPVTGDNSCPEKFYGLRLFTDMYFCVSDEYEWAAGVPFGGLFSCLQGNPLTNPTTHLSVLSPSSGPGQPHSLRAFMTSGGHSPDPNKGCPKGYSQHTASIEQGCAIHYCVKSGILTGPILPRVKRPPFSVAPPALVRNKDNLLLFDLQDQTWLRDEDAQKALSKLTPATDRHTGQQGDSDSQGALSPASAAGLAVGITLACVVMTTIGIFLVVRKRSQRQRRAYHRIRGQETSEGQHLCGGDDGRGHSSTADSARSQNAEAMGV